MPSACLVVYPATYLTGCGKGSPAGMLVVRVGFRVDAHDTLLLLICCSAIVSCRSKQPSHFMCVLLLMQHPELVEARRKAYAQRILANFPGGVPSKKEQ